MEHSYVVLTCRVSATIIKSKCKAYEAGKITLKVKLSSKLMLIHYFLRLKLGIFIEFYKQ